MSFSNLNVGTTSTELTRLREIEIFTQAREAAYLAVVSLDELYEFVYNSSRMCRTTALQIENKLVEAEKSLNPNASEFEVYQIILNLN